MLKISVMMYDKPPTYTCDKAVKFKIASLNPSVTATKSPSKKSRDPMLIRKYEEDENCAVWLHIRTCHEGKNNVDGKGFYSSGKEHGRITAWP